MKFRVILYSDYRLLAIPSENIGYKKYLELKKDIPNLELSHIPQEYNCLYKYEYEIKLEEDLVLNNLKLFKHFVNTNTVYLKCKHLFLNDYVNVRYELNDNILKRYVVVDEDKLKQYIIERLTTKWWERLIKRGAND